MLIVDGLWSGNREWPSNWLTTMMECRCNRFHFLRESMTNGAVHMPTTLLTSSLFILVSKELCTTVAHHDGSKKLLNLPAVHKLSIELLVDSSTFALIYITISNCYVLSSCWPATAQNVCCHWQLNTLTISWWFVLISTDPVDHHSSASCDMFPTSCPT